MIEKVWDPDSVRDRLLKQAIEQKHPLTCTLELTYRCNFRCRMCYIRMDDDQAASYGRMRTVKEWIEMAQQLYQAGVLYLILTGGECTRYPGFEELYAQLAKMGFRISIMSNAGSYTEAIRNLFLKYPPCEVAVSLYGGSNETYKIVTGDPQGFDRTIDNIRFLRSAGIPVSLNFTMIRQNVMDYPKVGRLCQELGIPYTLITDITGHQRNIDFSDAAECRLTPAERACVACHPPEEVALAMNNAKDLEKELEHFQMPSSASPVPSIETDNCIGSLTGCAIYWNGEMQTCISMNGYYNVKPFEIGFETAWTQLVSERQKTFYRPAVCQTCSMRIDCLHNCAARRFEGTGSPHEPDPYTCQYTYLLKLYKARQNRQETAQELICI